MKELFNAYWKFKEYPLDTPVEKMLSDTDFSDVFIPHDYMIYKAKELYRDSIGCYKKSFYARNCDENEYILRFEGVYMDSRVYINGKQVYEWKYGYSTFNVYISDYLTEGDNEIMVTCTYRSPNTRWYSGAGIFRNVYIYRYDSAYIVPDSIYLSNTDIDENGNSVLEVNFEVASKTPKGGTLIVGLFDSEGKLVEEKEEYLPSIKEKRNIDLSFDVKNVQRWSIDNPCLYQLMMVVKFDTVDNEITYGFRKIRFDSEEGFFLNDERVEIKGVCQHHDLGALGAAVNKDALRRQLEKLKDMGVNAIRTAHNMPCTELMDLADEMGFLVCSEAFDMWEKPKTEYDYSNYFVDWWKKDVTSWVKRDRNHPSLIMWSIGNEIYDTHAGNGHKWTVLLRDAIREIDYKHHAYIGIGSNYMQWEGAQECAKELELVGYNYGEKLYDEHHKKHPRWCIFGSETASTVQSRGIYHFPYEKRLLTYEDGQCSSLGNCSTNWGAKNSDTVIATHRDCSFAAGQFIWTGWDYIGEPTPYFSRNSFFGQIDTAGFEKDTYYMYKAEWNKNAGPMVHILPYWDFNEGQSVDVCAYTNGEYVELFVNGESKGMKRIDHNNGKELHARWKVEYHPGKIEAVAYDADKKEIARDEQHSFKDPAAIQLKSDKTKLYATGINLAFIEISVVDEDGNPVRNARNRMEVKVEGAGVLVGLDNGDSTDYDEYKGSSRRLFSGKLLAMVASSDEPGEIKITVTSSEIEGACLTLENEKYEDIFKEIADENDYNICDGMDYSLMTANYKSEFKFEVPVRKIELNCSESRVLGPDHKEAAVTYRILPESATYRDVVIKALTYDGIEANFVKVSTEGNTAIVSALGDGEFKLTAMCKNDNSVYEIISELEFRVENLGQATLNPYEFVNGILLSEASHPTGLSFEGGVFVDTDKESYVTYENVDFGETGSDEITIPIFSFEDKFGIKVYEGTYSDGELLGTFTYEAKSIYNTYQERTFKLSRKIKGVKAVTIEVLSASRHSIKGFSFKKVEKAYGKLLATENSRITGDSFTVTDETITSIGNNVTIEYDGMDFSQKGTGKITICGRSNNEKTSVHLLFIENDETKRVMIEVPFSDEYEERTYSIEDMRTSGKFALLFLPGSNFDLKWFKIDNA